MRKKVVERADHRCEAMVKVGEVWARCWDRPVEDHHMLTRARGGNLLDQEGEIYHHIALCRRHHSAADGAEAYGGGLLIDGYATVENNRVVYYGSDDYLRRKYCAEPYPDDQDSGTAYHYRSREVAGPS